MLDDLAMPPAAVGCDDSCAPWSGTMTGVLSPGLGGCAGNFAGDGRER